MLFNVDLSVHMCFIYKLCTSCGEECVNALIWKKPVLVLNFSTVVCGMVLVTKISFDFCRFLLIKHGHRSLPDLAPISIKNKTKIMIDEGKD